MLAWDAVVSAQVSFCFIPKVLDAVDMALVPFSLGESVAVVNALVTKPGDTQYVVAGKAVGVSDAIGEPPGTR